MKRRDVPRSVDVLTATLAVGAVGIGLAAGTTRSGPPWIFFPLLALLIVGGMLELQFEYRGHVEALDLFEAALMAVVLVTPGIGAVVLAALAKGVSQRLLRVDPVKASFNVVQWSASAAVASVVFVQLDGPTSTGGAQLSLLAVAMIAGIVVNHLSVTLVLALVQRKSVREVVGNLGSVIFAGWLLGGAVNISFGVLFTSLALTAPALVAVGLVPLAALHWAHRGYAEARADRARVQALQRATHELTTPVDPSTAIGAFLEAVRSSFESLAVDIVLFGQQHAPLPHHCGEIDTEQLSKKIVAGLGPGARAARAAAGDDSYIGELLERDGRRGCLYAPLRHGADVKGWMLSYDREGLEGFEAGEASIFEALAGELAGALERSELLSAVVRERAHLYDVVNRSSDAIFTITAEGNVETWNPAMADVTGYAVEELGSRGLAQLRPLDRNGAEVEFERWVDGRALPRDVEILTRGDERRWLACSYATTASTPTSLVVVARDVTRQREVDQLKDDFVATVSHELHTPLTSIMGFTNLLLDPGDMDVATQTEALSMIRKGTRRLSRLISNLLEVSIVEAQGNTTRSKPVDVNEACANVIEELRDSWPTRQIDFAPGSGAVMALGNPLSIEQILSNLVGNALKYAPNTAVRIQVEEQPEHLMVHVADNGPGIPPEHLDRIFDRFERLDHNHVQAGTGLGLYISRQLARAMGGQLTVESEVGRGTTFTLDLPAEVHLIAVG